MASQAVHDRDGILAELRELISQRTGYPRETLGLDLNLEADLGIDSIKRVEILSDLSDRLQIQATELPGTASANDGQSTPPLEMERLTALNTIRGILDYVETVLASAPTKRSDGGAGSQRSEANGDPRHAHLTVASNGLPHHGAAPAIWESSVNGTDHGSPARMEDPGVQRAIVRLIEAPADLMSPRLNGITADRGGGRVDLEGPRAKGAILIVDDGEGYGAALCELLGRMHAGVVRVQHAASARNGNSATDVPHADFLDADSVQALLDRVRERHGSITTVVSLLPLSPAEADASWDVLARRDAKSTFVLARAVADDLQRRDDDTSKAFLVVTGIDGGMGLTPEGPWGSQILGHGGVLGFVKCLAREWPDVLVRAIDIRPTETEPRRLADWIATELGVRYGPLEVGYHAGRRWTWQPVVAPLAPSGPPAFAIDSRDHILVTGGARGITAAVALEIAHRFRPQLILVGRSTPPAGPEAESTVGRTALVDIKAALLQQLAREGRPPAPTVVERRYRDLLRERELRSN
ncbi:MAG TPA: phosphopantetheine-binding protein, partial [Pirellulaceae bacterium]